SGQSFVCDGDYSEGIAWRNVKGMEYSASHHLHTSCAIPQIYTKTLKYKRQELYIFIQTKIQTKKKDCRVQSFSHAGRVMRL
ncbi:hypothetical protein, partial [Comamonas jiangduensis]|uniref:hypothetical protein n=1 Tax=Comamonas jiangduensis TaxID=1194168 RepID=UPI0028AD97D9